MKDPTVVLTEVDRSILESYKIFTAGLANYLGDGYELVLHSLESLNNSVIEIFNGHYTGRKIGSPVTDLALSMLDKIQQANENDYISYYTRNKKNEPLKATTIAIRGEDKKVIGLLCINFYLNTPFSAILNNFVDKQSGNEDVTENFVENIDDLIITSLNEAKETVYNDTTVSAANRNKAIITLLYHKGIFNIKDAVVKIAELLNISKNTVYMHMRNLNNKDA